ncbi:MAG: RsmE family RNA methyltransferase, partial [Arenicellales bacterium]
KAVLGEEETHHAGASRRIRVGDEIGLIDGRGTRAVAVVESVSHRALEFTVRARRRLRPGPSVSVAAAVPKGERFRTMIDMLSQIGVASIVPLVCERSMVRPRRSFSERWRRVAIEACKQSRNPYVPEIAEPKSLGDSLARIRDGDTIGFADAGGGMLTDVLPARGAFHLYIGPEGGFTEGEKALLGGAGGRPVNLGDNVLRVETAAVVAAALSLLAKRRSREE